MKEMDGGVRAGRKVRDEQKPTLGSCCSQRQVQSQRGRGAQPWWRGYKHFYGEREHVMGGRRHQGGVMDWGRHIWIAFIQSSWASLSRWERVPAWAPINVSVWFSRSVRLFIRIHWTWWTLKLQEQQGSVLLTICCPRREGKQKAKR